MDTSVELYKILSVIYDFSNKPECVSLQVFSAYSIKHSSLERKFLIYGRKKFYSMDSLSLGNCTSSYLQGILSTWGTGDIEFFASRKKNGQEKFIKFCQIFNFIPIWHFSSTFVWLTAKFSSIPVFILAQLYNFHQFL